ncbi:type IV secretion system protein [Sphingomonas sp. So64.6b]|uniref:type IV secretion system protein n=1 Tax=Sphingomonas sp. So64.6b TaxID=2997354 RepID=UPI0015FEE6B0|nr:type IV secretion system protein [Sphingomonas sp. So64.6b]QNA83303.1 type IV secretion system protein [Sphingomonas sp. So64.6b]
MACPSIYSGDAFLAGVLNYVDCQAQAIGQGGYQALATPGSGVSLMLGGVLTLFIALFGYRMILGQTPDARDGVAAVVKIGLVLVLATSWPAFRTLAYNVAMHGPAQLAANIGQPAGLPGSGGGLISRLQGVDNNIAALIAIGTGKPDDADVIAGPTQTLTPQQQQQEQQRLQRGLQRPRWDPAKDNDRLGQARTLYLTGAIAGFASVRLVAGLLLALGPLFALFLLFDATRGLFEGWVRGLVGATLGALSTAIILGVELALIEPWLANVLTQRYADIATPAAPVELLVMTLVFALTLIATLIAVAKVAHGFRIPDTWRLSPARLADALSGQDRRQALLPAPSRSAVADEPRSRAIAIADAVAASQRRDAAAPPPPVTQIGARIGSQAVSRDIPVAAATPLGQSNRRRTRGRVSAGAARRDGNR